MGHVSIGPVFERKCQAHFHFLRCQDSELATDDTKGAAALRLS